MDNLSHIKIKGFKSIKELDLEMKPINVLIGANGSGKSNFISIFKLFENINNKRLQEYLINGGGADGFLHFGSKITEEILIDVTIGKNKYCALLSKNDEKLGKENNKILHRAYRNKPLTKQQKQENKQRSSIRYIVERTFGLLKLHHELAKARYLGLERNKTRAQLIAMSHNLKTGMSIFKQMRDLQDCCVQ